MSTYGQYSDCILSSQMIMGKNFPYSRDGGVGVEADLGFEFRGLRYKEEVSEVTEPTVIGARRGAKALWALSILF